MAEFHFLRPWCFLAFIPWTVLIIASWKQNPQLQGWSDVCDPHLLDHLIQKNGSSQRMLSLSCLFLSLFFMIFSLTGPTWTKLPAPTYKPIEPRVLVLDLSPDMLATDLSPNRLSRAKFKLHDILTHNNEGQFGLIVYTGEAFVVSPLTEDGQTIDSLLSVLTPDIMPVRGQKLESALKEASHLIQQAGYQQGQILVLTASSPSSEAIETAKNLAQKGLSTSVMPIKSDTHLNPLFRQFAQAGQGHVLLYTSDSSDLESWLSHSRQQTDYILQDKDTIPLWRDQGPWFLIPALLFFLPVFQSGWLQRIK